MHIGAGENTTAASGIIINLELRKSSPFLTGSHTKVRMAQREKKQPLLDARQDYGMKT
jgi:hypothetical protein